VLFHPEEHARLGRLMAFGFRDLLRLHHEEGGLYSWWDYRQLGFPRNAGLRIDLVLGTEPVAARCTACAIDREERKGKQPSDHAPVVASIDD
jgi:exodeoxyribonuclease-3